MKKYCTVILAIALAIVTAFAIAVHQRAVESEENYRQSHTEVNALVMARHADSIHFLQTIESITEEYRTQLERKDSAYRVATSNTTTAKTMTRIVYKDSVKEVYTENTETILKYEERISRLTDSLHTALTQKDGTTVEYVEKVIHDTIFVRDEVHDTVSLESKTASNEPGKLGLYASGAVKYGQDGFGFGADAGFKYYVAGPLYLKAGAEYTGKVNGVLGAGLDIRF